jgi:hypothetical protein
MDEATLTARWQALSGGRPLPSLPEVDVQWTKDFFAALDILCDHVVDALLAENTEVQEAMARRIERVMTRDLPLEGVQDFLQTLVARLRVQDTQALAEKLQWPFRDIYMNVVAAVGQEEMESADEDDDAVVIEDLPRLVSVICQVIYRICQDYDS